MATLPFDVFWRDHGAKAGLKGLSKEAQEAARRQDEFRAKAKLAGAVVGVALLKLAKDAIAVASDIGESQSKVQVVFGRSAGAVRQLGETSAKSLGISKSAALEAAGTFGNLFVSLRLPQSEAAKMSTRMVQLSADMASFNNASPEEALEALRAGLVGETEPLRRFGVNINDAALRQKALDLGLVKTTKDTLPASVKAQASYALILEQTTTAQGDFARTSGGLANQQRILKAQFSDLQGELGQKLLPAAVKVTSSLVDLVEFLDAHGKTVAITAGSIAAVAGSVYAVNKASAAFKATSQAWETVTGAMASFSKEGSKARGALGSIGSFMTGPWGAALLVGGGALAIWAKKQQDARQHVDDLRRSLDQQTGALTANSRESIYSALVQEGAIKAARDLGISLKDLTDAAEGSADAQARVNGVLGAARSTMGNLPPTLARSGSEYERLKGAISSVEGAIGGQNEAVNQARQEWEDQKEAQVGAAGATEDLTSATVDNTGALDDNVEKLSEREGLLGRRSAQRNYEQAIDDATRALKENGKTLDDGTEKGRDNEEALDRIATAAYEYRTAITKAGGSQETANRIQKEAFAKLVTTRIAMGDNKKSAEKYARAVLGIPNKSGTKVNLDKKAATDAINTFERRLARIPDKRVTVGAALSFPRGWAQYRQGERSSTGRAHGGPIGEGTGTQDDQPILAMRGEHMWTTRETRAVGGHDAMYRIRRAALRGELKGYAAGGPIGSTSPRAVRAGVARMESNLDHLAVAFGRSLQRQINALGGGPLAGGWRSQWAAVHRAFPGAQLHSAYRPGAITASGNRSYHSMGRAIDVTPSMSIFRWIARNYGARTRELIFSTAGTDQLKNGRRHWYGEPVRGMHWNHIHWAYDRGGVASGAGWIPKQIGAPERVLSPAQTRSFDQLVRVLDRGGGQTINNVTLSAPNYVGSVDQLLGTLSDAARSGRLDRILGRR